MLQLSGGYLTQCFVLVRGGSSIWARVIGDLQLASLPDFGSCFCLRRCSEEGTPSSPVAHIGSSRQDKGTLPPV